MDPDRMDIPNRRPHWADEELFCTDPGCPASEGRWVSVWVEYGEFDLGAVECPECGEEGVMRQR